MELGCQGSLSVRPQSLAPARVDVVGQVWVGMRMEMGTRFTAARARSGAVVTDGQDDRMGAMWIDSFSHCG